MKPDMHADQQGPTIQPKLAQLINKLWWKDRDSETYKQIMKKYPRTENLEAQEVEVNPEVHNLVSRMAKNRDAKLKSAQAGISRAAVPLTKIAEQLVKAKQGDVDKQLVLDLTIDTLTLLANTNEVVNQIRQEAIKPSKQYRFQTLCMIPNGEDTSKLLFWNSLSERIKAAAQGGRLGKRPYQFGYGAQMRGRGHGYSYHPYAGYTPMRGGYGWGRPFLGKSIP